MEERFAAPKVFMTTSCTSALEMAALLCGIEGGDEVIMPSYTFSSTANAFYLCGAKCMFVDIRPDTLNLDETLLEAAITERTKAIVPVHYAGVGCEMDAIKAIAGDYGLYVIEDAALGVNAKYHYGVQSLGAMFSAVSLLPPHTSLVLVVAPIIVILKLWLSVILFDEASDRNKLYTYVGVAVLLLGSSQYLVHYLDLNAVSKLIRATERYQSAYPLLSSLFGVTLTIAVLATIVRFESKDARMLGAFLVGSLPLFKIPYFPYVTCGLVCVYIYKIIITREYRLAAYPAGAIVLTLFNMF